MKFARYSLVATLMAATLALAACDRKGRTGGGPACAGHATARATCLPIADRHRQRRALRHRGRGGSHRRARRSAAGLRSPLKVAFAYVGAPSATPAGHLAHDRGRQEMEAALAGEVKTTYIESVPENADAERVLRDLATRGNKVHLRHRFRLTWRRWCGSPGNFPTSSGSTPPASSPAATCGPTTYAPTRVPTLPASSPAR